jgi:hypothetical protein
MLARVAAHGLLSRKRLASVHPSVKSRTSSLLFELRRSFSAEPFPITGTLPLGGKGVAVSQYAEVRSYLLFLSCRSPNTSSRSII